MSECIHRHLLWFKVLVMIEAQLSLPNNNWIYWFILRVDGLSDALVLSIVWQHSKSIYLVAESLCGHPFGLQKD